MPGTAKAAGCCIDCGGAKLYGRRRCIACYGRHKRALKRAGAFTPLRVEGSTKDRLLAHVAAGWGGCILRTVAIDRDGYGLIRESNGKTRRAHRVAYELLVGPIADGLHLDHLCHTRDLSCPGGAKCLHRRCINPDHLEPVTSGENTARGGNSRKTHCKNGHEFSPENTHVSRRGRSCRACASAAAMRYRARQANKDVA
jgi:hypothetical protein